MKECFIKLEENEIGIVKLIINNSSSKNALNPTILNEITANLKNLKERDNLRLLIVTGAGNAFSAGADLEWMKASKGLSLSENKRDALNFSNMLKNLEEFPVPTLALVNGSAYGGGLGIIAACDFAVSFKEAKYCFSEVKLGLIPAMIGPYVLRVLGYKKTKYLFLTGKVFTAEEALKINLIDFIGNEDEVHNWLNKFKADILNGGPKAQKEIKNFLLKINNRSIDDALLDEASQSIASIRISEEGQEGIKAFLDKKKPKWVKS